VVLTREEVTFGALFLWVLDLVPLVSRTFSRRSSPLWLCLIVIYVMRLRITVVNFNVRVVNSQSR
jgi:hypothetical protein